MKPDDGIWGLWLFLGAVIGLGLIMCANRNQIVMKDPPITNYGASTE